MHTSFVVPTHQLTADKLKDMRKVQIALTRNPQCLLANHKLKTDRNSLSLTVSPAKLEWLLSRSLQGNKKRVHLYSYCAQASKTQVYAQKTRILNN